MRVVFGDPTCRSPLQISRLHWSLPTEARLASTFRVRSTEEIFLWGSLHSRTWHPPICVPCTHVR